MKTNMKTNIRVQNFLKKHRSDIALATNNSPALFAELERLFQEMYDIGFSDGWDEAWTC